MTKQPSDIQLPEFDQVLPDWWGWTIGGVLIGCALLGIVLAVCCAA